MFLNNILSFQKKIPIYYTEFYCISEEDTKEKGKLYKPTSKLAELAEKFSSAEKAAQYANNRVEKDKPEKPGKKKEKEKKKKSNLELFKEELKM